MALGVPGGGGEDGGLFGGTFMTDDRLREIRALLRARDALHAPDLAVAVKELIAGVESIRRARAAFTREGGGVVTTFAPSWRTETADDLSKKLTEAVALLAPLPCGHRVVEAEHGSEGGTLRCRTCRLLSEIDALRKEVEELRLVLAGVRFVTDTRFGVE
jgi:hypothetical protein